MSQLDFLQPPPPRVETLQRSWSALQLELGRPRTSWRKQSLAVIAAGWAVGLAVIVVSAASGTLQSVSHVTGLVSLALAGPALVWVGARPGSTTLRRLTFAAIPVCGALMLLGRAHDAANHDGEWLCTLSHVGVALPALALSRRLLSGMAFDLKRALATGAGIGTTGALLGELLCGRDAWHIALFHGSAWGLITAGVVALAWWTPRRSFAP